MAWIEDLVSAFFAHLCHQLSERTLGAVGPARWLCARCAGFYAGVLVVTIVHTTLRRGAARPRGALAVAALLIGIGAADALLPGMLVPATNLVRFVTGLGAGVGLGVAANPLLHNLVAEGGAPRAAGAYAAAIAMVAIAMVVAAAVGSPGILAGVTAFGGVGFVVTALLVNALVAARAWVALDGGQSARGKGVAAIAGGLFLVEVALIWISPVRRG